MTVTVNKSQRNSKPTSPAWKRKIVFILMTSTFLNAVCLVSIVFSSIDNPFNTPSNRGSTGLIEIPNARVTDEGILRLGYSGVDPYRWYYLSIGALPGMEMTVNYTEVSNVRAFFFDTYKDRGFDIKFQILEESRKYPAVAIGVQDVFGTRLFASEYIAVSRQFLPFDFTMGIGHNRLRGPLHLSFFDKIGLFGGIEVELHEKLHLSAEYNPIEYEKDRGNVRNAVPSGAKFPANFGIKSNIIPGVDIGLSYQRGEVFGFSLNLSTELGKPVLYQKPDPPAQVPSKTGPSLKTNGIEIIDRIRNILSESKLTGITVFTDGEEVMAEFENNYYMSNQKAVGRVLRVLCFQSPGDTKKITAIVKRRGFNILIVSVDPQHMRKYLYGEMPRHIFYQLLDIQLAGSDEYRDPASLLTSGEGETEKFKWGIKPDLETFIGDQTKYVQFRAGIKPWGLLDIWKGAQIYARYDIPVYSNVVSTADIPLDAVRSDSYRYLDTDHSFDRLMIDQIFRVSHDTFSRISFGYLEKAYAGISGEMLSFLGQGKYAIGIEADWVRKRDPDSPFGFIDFDTYTFFGNIYHFLPKYSITTNIKAGRFMYGDYGALFQVSREFNTGARVGLWFSYTGTDELTGFNRDANRSGFSITIPIRAFLTHDSRQAYSYSISPWTRDAAATVFHWQTIYDLVSDLTPASFRANIEQIEE